MSQQRLLQMVISVLLMAGYEVSERCGVRPRSFDIISGNDELLFIIKVVSSIDSVAEESTGDLAIIARYLKGIPLIVGDKTRDTELERGAVYIRYGIIAVNVPTLYDYVVEGIPPLVVAHPGGLYVNINGDLLHDLREQHQMSLGDLAKALGVSRRTISKYESGMGTTLEIAVKIEEIFDTPIVEAIDILSYNPQVDFPKEMPGRNIPPDLERIGMEIFAMRRAPFQALALYENETILTGYGPAQKIIRRAKLIGNISDITGTRAVCVITDLKKKKKIGTTLIIGEESLQALEDGTELIELIDE